MDNKVKKGRPPKKKELKRCKAFLLKMKEIEYDIIKSFYLLAQEEHDIESLTDFIIKSATGKINFNNLKESMKWFMILK